MAFDLKKLILEGTQYVSGYENENDDYVISASMVGNDHLQNYLSIIHGKPPEKEITDATLGTIFHRGMDSIVKEKMAKNYTEGEELDIIGSEVPMHVKLSNDWILSGTADLIVRSGTNRFEIHDYKLTKNYTRKMMKKNINTHSYTKQLNILNALFRENMAGFGVRKILGDITLVADFFLKDSKAIEFEPVHNPLVAPNTWGTKEINATETILKEVVEITDELQKYIESGEVPPKCADTWERYLKGKRIQARCALYCSHGREGLCPYYSPTTRETVDRLTDW
jgi:hypothetical protein